MSVYQKSRWFENRRSGDFFSLLGTTNAQVTGTNEFVPLFSKKPMERMYWLLYSSSVVGFYIPFHRVPDPLEIHISEKDP